MAGNVKRLLDELIEVRARGNAGVEHFLRAHLRLNGIDPGRYNEGSADEPQTERRLQQMIDDFRESERGRA